MSNPTTIYVVRHGQSEGNIKTDTAVLEAFKKHGEAGPPLTELGRNQAHDVAKKLQHVHFDAIFASHMVRAIQTAEIIAAGRNIDIISNNTIGERSYGNKFWELSLNEREKLEQAMDALDDEENLHYRFFPDTESNYEAITRFNKFLENIIPLYRGKTILVVSHGNLMRTFLKVIGWTTSKELPAGAVVNTGYFILETDGKTFHVKETWGVNKATK